MIPAIFTNGATALTQMSDFTNTSTLTIVGIVVAFGGLALFKRVIGSGAGR